MVPGLLLAVSTVIALSLINGPAANIYIGILGQKFIGLSLVHWINDGLMTIFFYAVGLEIKRELTIGELSTRQKAMFPVFAALGGMIAPALIYLAMNSSSIESRGWAIPIATDIAFAIGVLSALGSRVPLPLKIFLLALAIVDDLGAILVIALFYTEQLHALGLALAVGATTGIVLALRFQILKLWIYLGLGLTLWYGLLHSGVHATLAGVIAGLLTPLELRGTRPLDSFLKRLHPLMNFGIMPIFALANAGVVLTSLNSLIESRVALGVGLGLIIGKPVGILTFSALATSLNWARLPKNVTWLDIIGVSFLAGIGFTMSIFISNLSLRAPHDAHSKMAILLASICSAFLGYVFLSVRLKYRR